MYLINKKEKKIILLEILWLKYLGKIKENIKEKINGLNFYI